MNIREMLNIQDEQLLSFVPDYKINLIAPFGMEKDDFLKFHTNVGQLLEFIKYSKDKEKLEQMVHDGERFRSLEVETANLINTITGSDLKFEVKEGRVDVCKAIEEMRRECKSEGRMEGVDETRLESIRNIMVTLKLTAQQAMDALLIPVGEQSKYSARLPQ